MAKQKRREGDFVAIDLGGGYCAFGRVLPEPLLVFYDFRTKGCSDGLQKNGVNLNQGAESMLSFMMALLNIIESYGPSPSLPQPLKTPTGTASDNADKQAQMKK